MVDNQLEKYNGIRRTTIEIPVAVYGKLANLRAEGVKIKDIFLAGIDHLADCEKVLGRLHAKCDKLQELVFELQEKQEKEEK